MIVRGLVLVILVLLETAVVAHAAWGYRLAAQGALEIGIPFVLLIDVTLAIGFVVLAWVTLHSLGD